MQYEVNMDSLTTMYKKMYWGQIMSRNTSWSVKWVAIRSLWIMRSFNKKKDNPIKVS